MDLLCLRGWDRTGKGVQSLWPEHLSGGSACVAGGRFLSAVVSTREGSWAGKSPAKPTEVTVSGVGAPYGAHVLPAHEGIFKNLFIQHQLIEQKYASYVLEVWK